MTLDYWNVAQDCQLDISDASESRMLKYEIGIHERCENQFLDESRLSNQFLDESRLSTFLRSLSSYLRQNSEISSSFSLISSGTFESKQYTKCSRGFQGRWVISSLQPSERLFVNLEYSASFILKIQLMSQFQKYYSICFRNYMQNTQATSPEALIRAKDVLSKVSSKLSGFPITRDTNIVMQSVRSATKKIGENIDSKIQKSYISVLHTPTVMPMQMHSDCSPSGRNLPEHVEGTKNLMENYWEKIKEEGKKRHRSKIELEDLKQEKDKNKENTPDLGRSKKTEKFILHHEPVHNDETKQKKLKSKEEELKKRFYSYIIPVVDCSIATESEEFISFQKIHYKKWSQITVIIRSLENFVRHYAIRNAELNLNRLLEVSELHQKKKKMDRKMDKKSFDKNYTTESLLSCFENAEKLSEDYYKPGIRFYGNKGRRRAIVLIQSHIRRYQQMKKYQKIKKIIGKVTLIQRSYRMHLKYQETKHCIKDLQLKKISNFNVSQAEFMKNYSTLQLTSKIKYEIHISSLSLSEWQKLSSPHYQQLENSEICRIFKLFRQNANSAAETRIIYISPVPLSSEIINYYFKIFELEGYHDHPQRLHFYWPQSTDHISVALSLCQRVLYSHPLLKKITRVIGSNYAYIVPSIPSNEYILLCSELGYPLYGSKPQELLFLQSKAGSKTLATTLKEEEGFKMLPFGANVYSAVTLLTELSQLVVRNPKVGKWMLKIDSEISGRGLAYFEVSKLLPKKRMQSLNKYKVERQQEIVYKILEESLLINKQERVIPFDRKVYVNQDQFLKQFYIQGGIIQAFLSPNSGQIQDLCFCIEVEPNFHWKVLASFEKLSSNCKPIGCYYDIEMVEPPVVQINQLVDSLIARKLFGFFVLKFIRQFSNTNALSHNSQQTQNVYFNGIKCHMDSFACVTYLKETLAKNSSMLYFPLFSHPSLRELRMQTFFHLCRLQNISFDIERKVGNVFMFVDSLESACLGVLSINKTGRSNIFAQVAEVLDFLDNKLDRSRTSKSCEIGSFATCRNLINCHLNKTRRLEKKATKVKAVSEDIYLDI